MVADLGGSIAQLLRVALAAFILIHFLRRIIKAGTHARVPQTPRVRRDPNAFRDEPPPPENPHLG